MAWTAGVTRTTGDLVTAANWNAYLGASGSLDYLKTETDKIDDCSFDEPTRALDTQYQNGSSLRIVAIGLNLEDEENVVIRIGASSADNNILSARQDGATEVNMPITFIVPPSYYYMAYIAGGTPTKSYWAEWDIH